MILPMIRSDYLMGLFASILGGLALPACGIDCGDDAGSPSMPELHPTGVDPAQLSAALVDGVLDPQECAALCGGDPVTTSATATDGSSTGGSTSGGSTSGESTGDGSTSGGSTTTGSTGDGSTGDGSTTEGSTSSGSTSGEGSTTEGSTTTGEAMSGTCKAIEGETALVSCLYEVNYACGRRPSGLCSEGKSCGPTPLARFFAESAHLEAASVTAFERLAAELRAMAAPDELIVAAERAAADEVRHARDVGVLAERSGGLVSPVDMETATERSTLEIAIENATEGCVGETWGALLAAHQAAAAEDPELRRCMEKIAADEARHAALAWAVDAFFNDRLSATERSQVEAARRHAALCIRTSQPSPPELAALVGLPAAAPRERLWEALDQELWHAA